MGAERRVRGVRSWAAVSARCWPTSTCTMSLTSGSSDGDAARRTATWSLCDSQTTSSWDFEHRGEAERFLTGLRERFARFGLMLHPNKTRLLEFGRYAAATRRRRGERKPETVNF